MKQYQKINKLLMEMQNFFLINLNAYYLLVHYYFESIYGEDQLQRKHCESKRGFCFFFFSYC